MKYSSILTAAVVIAASCSMAVAQQGRTAGGAGTTGTGTNTIGGGGAAGGTTEGIGGVTTQGIGNAASANGAEAGANAATRFIGGANAEAFVGGALQSTLNSSLNRQFRSLQNANVPYRRKSATVRIAATGARFVFNWVQLPFSSGVCFAQ